MPTIFDVAASFRRDLDLWDEAASSRLTRRYGQVYTRLRREIDSTVASIQALEANDPRAASLLARRERLSTLLADTKVQLNEYARYASAEVQKEQASAIGAAKAHAVKLMGAAVYGDDSPQVLARFQGLPDGAFLDLVGFTQAGSPLADLLAGLDAGSDVLERSLLEGLALGKGARAIAREARSALALPLSHTLTIARTETLRAYRESTRRVYEANDHLLDGWQWFSARDRRSCAACWAMHGTVHTSQERLDGHPNCRCSMVPVVKGRDRLVKEAADEFGRLSDEDQRFILGRERYRLYKDGTLKLDDMVARSDDPRWGTMRRQASVKEALRNAERRQLGQITDREKVATKEAEQVKPLAADPISLLRQMAAAKPTDPETLIRMGGLVQDQIDARIVKMAERAATIDAKIEKINAQADAMIERMSALGFDNPEWDRMFADKKKLERQRERLYKERDGLYPHEVRKKATKEVLAELRPMGGKVSWDYRKYAGAKPQAKADTKALLDRQLQYLPSEWIEDTKKKGALQYELVPESAARYAQRGHYDPSTNRVRLTWYNTDATAIHEITHAVEATRPNLKAAQQAFYEYRTAGEPLIKMADEFPGSNYASHEVFRRDKFETAYMGKDYGGAFFELATMGTEAVYHPDPFRNKIDDEMKRWILGVLAAV